MASWFYLRAGKKCGPVGSVELRKLARSGQLLPTDSIWKDGLPDWVPASDAKGLFDFVPQVVQVVKELVNETEPPTPVPHSAEVHPNAEQPVNATSSGVLVRSTFSKINPGHLLIAVSLFASAFITVAYHVVVDAKVEPHALVDLPNKLVASNGSHDTEQKCVFKKLFC